MNKEFFLIISKRFTKGLLSAVAAFSVLFLLDQIPVFVQLLPSVVSSPITVSIVTAALLALEKFLQGYKPQ